MSLVINTNVSALNAQRQLVSSGNDLQQAMERLSSGRRINSAGDDAAGLAISNRQTSQIRGLNQAIRNASDGVSLIQTAEGALDETTNIMQRMRELSIQAANGIYSDADRATLDAEFQQLLEELDRIAETTSFNGQNLLDGSLGDVELQVGAEAGQIIDFSITAVTTSDLGLGAVSSDLNGSSVSADASIGEGDVLINNQALSAITNLGGPLATDTTFDDVLQDINDNIGGVTATGYNIIQADGAGSGVIPDNQTLRLTLASTGDQASVIYDISGTDSLDDLVESINTITGGNITADVNDSGKLTLSNATGGTITISADTDNTDNGGVFDVQADGTADTLIQSVFGIDTGGTDGTKDYTGNIALTSDDGDTITITRGADGTDADLEALGFPSVTGAGEVLGQALVSSDQNLALVSNDLKINGVNIGSIDENAGLQAKVDAINTVSDETGVTATVSAIDAFTPRVDDTFTELTATGFPTAGIIDFNGVPVDFTGDTTAQDAAESINVESTNTGVSAFVDTNGALHLFSAGQITLTDGAGGAVANFTAFTPLTIPDALNPTVAAVSGTTYTALTPDDTSAGSIAINGTVIPLADLSSLDTIVNNLNAESGSTGVRAAIDNNGELELTSSSRINISLGGDNGLASLAVLGIELTANATTTNLSDDVFTIDPSIGLNSANDAPISIEATENGTLATGLLSLNTDLSSSVTGSALASLSIGTTEGASAAIDSIDQALETVNDIRSDLGAINNRLDFTMSNLSNITENTSAARSRIVDADFAAESANLSRAQVLQQASQAMLAQANAQPQQVLQLLQG